MDALGIGLFQLASDRMSYLSERHKVIAGNVANANTPDYVAQDLKPFEAALADEQLRLAATRPGHIDVSGDPAASFRLQRKTPVWEVTPSGNSVTLEQEMLKASETAGSYALVSNVYKSSYGMLKMAAGAQG